jgi:hypothetical protein
VIIAFFDLRFAWALAPALGTLFVVGAALATYEWRRSAERPSDINFQVPAINPLQIPAAITFAVIFVVISAITESIRTAFGQTGVLVGFTHICGTSRSGGYLILRHTIRQRLREKLRQVKEMIGRLMHRPVAELIRPGQCRCTRRVRP